MSLIHVSRPSSFTETALGGPSVGTGSKQTQSHRFCRHFGIPRASNCVEELKRAATQGHFGNERWHMKKDGGRFWPSEAKAVNRGALRESSVISARVTRGRSCGAAACCLESAPRNRRCCIRRVSPCYGANDAFLYRSEVADEEGLRYGACTPS